MCLICIKEKRKSERCLEERQTKGNKKEVRKKENKRRKEDKREKKGRRKKEKRRKEGREEYE